MILVRSLTGKAAFCTSGLFLFTGTALALVVGWTHAVFSYYTIWEDAPFTGLPLAALSFGGGVLHIRELPQRGWRTILLGTIVGFFCSFWSMTMVFLPEREVYRTTILSLIPVAFWPAGMLFAQWFWARRRGVTNLRLEGRKR